MTLSSHQLADVFQAAAGDLTAATVPVGERWILRDVRLIHYNVGPQQRISTYIRTVNGDFFISSGLVLAFETVVISDGFIVLDAGDLIRIRSAAGNCSIVASGHRFTL